MVPITATGAEVLAVAAAAVTAAVFTGRGPAKTRLARMTRMTRPGAGTGLDSGPRRDTGRGADTASDPIAGHGAALGSPRGRLAAALLVALACALTAGGMVGLLLGPGAGWGTWRALGRLEPAHHRRVREHVQAQLPLAADLLAAVVAAGCPPDRAVEHVGRALGGPIGSIFVTAAASARVASDATHGWAVFTEHPVLAPLGRALGAAASRGTSPVPALERSAQDARHSARWAAESRSRALGARAAAPLGLCFLPAFVLVGIVPIVAGSGFLAG
ncbi:type II secretion system F family protein [Phytoactinopolyspora halotolerans]|uniref:Type II secretion system protein GspF domain-containing protein n=1 Tax=Phytoactinopolyspora halotolerans TaxID=1981512 RepID=A0A6L9S3C6_9ACTN|nr:type II secretion system F family protein [Phytoactinopolyspora halotolerans]NED99133.1 hypothetical protein [Phytoactinopolyspora halotolerans]